MSEFNTMIPIGFRFDPTDEELIKGFLWPRLMGLELPWNGVVEKELYGDNAAPWEVFSDVDDASMYWHSKKEGGATKNTIYAFTTLTKVSNSKRISRRAGCGTWSGQTGPKSIKDSDSGEIIGHMRMLSFQLPKSDATSSDLGHWIMHEYSLSDDMVRFSGHTNGGNLVLCKITKCVKKDSGGHHTGPQPQFFYPAIGNGGGSIDISVAQQQYFYPAIDVSVPAAAVSKKRAAEEEYSDAGCKKQKLLCDGDGNGNGNEGFPDGAAEGCVVGDESRPSDFDDNIDDSLFDFGDDFEVDIELLMQLSKCIN